MKKHHIACKLASVGYTRVKCVIVGVLDTRYPPRLRGLHEVAFLYGLRTYPACEKCLSNANAPIHFESAEYLRKTADWTSKQTCPAVSPVGAEAAVIRLSLRPDRSTRFSRF